MNGISLASQAIGAVLPPPPAWNRIAGIGIPVRVLCGDLDIPHIQERSRHLAASIPTAEFEAVPGAAHLPSLEQPDRTTERITRLLTQIFEH